MQRIMPCLYLAMSIIVFTNYNVDGQKQYMCLNIHAQMWPLSIIVDFIFCHLHRHTRPYMGVWASILMHCREECCHTSVSTLEMHCYGIF